jgi:hypothetical protein
VPKETLAFVASDSVDAERVWPTQSWLLNAFVDVNTACTVIRELVSFVTSAGVCSWVGHIGNADKGIAADLFKTIQLSIGRTRAVLVAARAHPLLAYRAIALLRIETATLVQTQTGLGHLVPDCPILAHAVLLTDQEIARRVRVLACGSAGVGTGLKSHPDRALPWAKLRCPPCNERALSQPSNVDLGQSILTCSAVVGKGVAQQLLIAFEGTLVEHTRVVFELGPCCHRFVLKAHSKRTIFVLDKRALFFCLGLLFRGTSLCWDISETFAVRFFDVRLCPCIPEHVVVVHDSSIRESVVVVWVPIVCPT